MGNGQGGAINAGANPGSPTDGNTSKVIPRMEVLIKGSTDHNVYGHTGGISPRGRAHHCWRGGVTSHGSKAPHLSLCQRVIEQVVYRPGGDSYRIADLRVKGVMGDGQGGAINAGANPGSPTDGNTSKVIPRMEVLIEGSTDHNVYSHTGGISLRSRAHHRWRGGVCFTHRQIEIFGSITGPKREGLSGIHIIDIEVNYVAVRQVSNQQVTIEANVSGGDAAVLNILKPGADYRVNRGINPTYLYRTREIVRQAFHC